MDRMQTPPRSVPGIWPQTPAPRSIVPAPSFSTSVSQSTRSPPVQQYYTSTSLAATRPSEVPAQTQLGTSTSRSAETLTPRERAAKTINGALQEETRFPELDGYLTQGFSYEYDLNSSPAWAPFQKVRMYNIPDQIFEQYNRAQVSTSMGLFAEIHYAWVTIDNALYMWDYTMTTPDLVGFEEQPNSITAVKLAVPRKDIFVSNIKHIIVLATTSQIMLLGMGTDNTPGSPSLTLFHTGMSTSVTGLDVSIIASSDKTGRVFFGGRTENEVYELTYQQEEGWFSSRCAKVCHTAGNMGAFGIKLGVSASLGLKPRRLECVLQMVVDDSRDLLYTLSSESSIRVFHIRKEGGLPILIAKSASAIYSNVAHIITPNESLNARTKIVSISAISAQEASRYHLVATTATGYRLYLSATSSGFYSNSIPGTPGSMQAQHVKTPPPQPYTVAQQQPQQLGQPAGQVNQQLITYEPTPQQSIRYLTPTRTAQRYAPGSFFCFISNPNSVNDTLFISTPEAARLVRTPESGQPSKSMEAAMELTLDGRAEDIGLCTPYHSPSAVPAGFANESAVQFDKPVIEVAILTNARIHVIQRRRLVDIFASLVQQHGGTEGFQGEVSGLIRTYGRTETLATALAVACGQGSEVSPDSRLAKIIDPEVLDVAQRVFMEYGGKPTYNENLVADKSVPAIETVKPSPRHAAIVLYLSRLLRSTWRTLIAKQSQTPIGYSILPVVELQKLRTVQEDLFALQRFFQKNRSSIQGLSGPDDVERSMNKNDEVANQGEHRALHSLVKFTSDTIEGISFVLVLFDERVAEIVALLPEQSRLQFLQLTFEGLFSTAQGYALAKELVKAIVNRNIANGSNVETVAEALRRKCGSFCSSEDVVIFKAQEQLKRASEAGANAEYARNLLNESLNLFQQVADKLPRDYLEQAVKQYTALQFYAGAIQLTLKVAYEADRGNEALSWMTDGKPESDKRKLKFEQRSQCYDLIHGVIKAVDDSIAQTPAFIDGRPTLSATRRNEASDLISRTTDEVFLTNLYDWYLSQQWYDRLLATESPFIVTYLQRKSADDLTHADLLWKYYGQTSQFYEAARVQLQLAQSTFNLSLDRRIEYLSRARASASTYSQGPVGGRKTKQKLLQDISEFLEVANIQDEILQRIRDDKRFQQLPPDQKATILSPIDGPILPLTTLFNQYADAANYYDICLQIYQVADHRDKAQIEDTWKQFLDQKHNETVSSPRDDAPLPFEVIAETFRSLGSKLHSSPATFPIPYLLAILESYSFNNRQAGGPPHWVVSIFLSLRVTYEAIFGGLESVFFENKPPLSGANRRAVVADLVYIVEKWLEDSTRMGGILFDGEAGTLRVDQMLKTLLQMGQQAGMDGTITQRVREIRGRVGEMVH